MALNNSITVGGTLVSSSIIDAGISAMHGQFTNMDVAAAMGHAGFEKDDLWLRQEIANRLLQRVRKAGLIQFKKGKWSPKAITY